MNDFLSLTNKWKLLSFALMGILATGFLVPGALGQPRPGPPEVWEAIDGLEQQINDIASTPGPQGEPGADGLDCWDSNGDGVEDESEDVNDDGVHDAEDCQGPQGEPGADGADGQDADTTALQAEVDALEIDVADLTARIEALEADGGDGGGGAIDPDVHEPNDSLAEAADIGFINEDEVTHTVTELGNMHLTSDEDWYVLNVLESSAADSDLNIEILLSSIPTGSDYDLHVTCLGCDGILPSASSANSGSVDESIPDHILTKSDTSGPDSVVLQIEVRNVSDTASADEYSLTITVT